MTQAFALAVFLLRIPPQGSVTWKNDLPGRKNPLTTPADYVKTVSNSQDAQALDGQQSESVLVTESFDTVETDHAVLLNLTHSQLVYRRANFDFSLIRSPPIGASLNRL
jgi:hypothetical protein